jgi:hypothetical protein
MARFDCADASQTSSREDVARQLLVGSGATITERTPETEGLRWPPVSGACSEAEAAPKLCQFFLRGRARSVDQLRNSVIEARGLAVVISFEVFADQLS